MLRKFLTGALIFALAYLVFAVALNRLLIAPMLNALQNLPDAPQEADFVLDIAVEGDVWMLALIDQRGATPTTVGPFEITDAIVVPADIEISLTAKSNDTLQPFSYPELGINEDIVPGRITVLEIGPLIQGEYLGDCGSFCDLPTTVIPPPLHVSDDAAFQDWLAGQSQ